MARTGGKSDGSSPRASSRSLAHSPRPEVEDQGRRGMGLVGGDLAGQGRGRRGRGAAAPGRPGAKSVRLVRPQPEDLRRDVERRRAGGPVRAWIAASPKRSRMPPASAVGAVVAVEQPGPTGRPAPSTRHDRAGTGRSVRSPGRRLDRPTPPASRRRARDRPARRSRPSARRGRPARPSPARGDRVG